MAEEWWPVSEAEVHRRWCVEAEALDLFRTIHTTDREGVEWVIGPCLHGAIQYYPAPLVRQETDVVAQKRRARYYERKRADRG